MLTAEKYSAGKVTITNVGIEIKKYSKPYYADTRKSEITKKNKDNENFEKRDRNLYRAQNKVRQIINCNLTPHTKFLTLTTAETVLDEQKFRRMLTSFFQAMKRQGYQLRYVGVLEHQKERGIKEGNEGSWHCHLVIFNNEYIPFEVINKYWKGNTDIHILDGLRVVDGIKGEKINNVADYVCKYITKDNFNEFHKQVYLRSNHLLNPIEFNLPIYKLNDDTYIIDPDDNEYDVLKELKKDFIFNEKAVIKRTLPFDSESIQVKTIQKGIRKPLCEKSKI